MDKNVPVQLSLFSLLPDNNEYSNTIELYDMIPKYVLGKDKTGGKLDPIERKFTYKNTEYRVVIQPARIKNESGIYIDVLPGQREEFVEDALRKIATDGNSVYLGKQIGVYFTLYQLRKELKRTGHTYSYDEIREAIKILVSCNMELKMVSSEGKEQQLYTENLFNRMVAKTENYWNESEKFKSKYLVIFNALVQKSVMEITFRRYNYELCMKYKNSISRYLHKRISHNYIQASMMNPYVILATTIIEGSGMKKYEKMSDNHKYILKGIEEMKINNVLVNYSYEKSGEEYKYTLVPSASFVAEIKRSNKIQHELLGIGGVEEKKRA